MCLHEMREVHENPICCVRLNHRMEPVSKMARVGREVLVDSVSISGAVERHDRSVFAKVSLLLLGQGVGYRPIRYCSSGRVRSAASNMAVLS